MIESRPLEQSMAKVDASGLASNGYAISSPR
jgi:hypothetical protein